MSDQIAKLMYEAPRETSMSPELTNQLLHLGLMDQDWKRNPQAIEAAIVGVGLPNDPDYQLVTKLLDASEVPPHLRPTPAAMLLILFLGKGVPGRIHLWALVANSMAQEFGRRPTAQDFMFKFDTGFPTEEGFRHVYNTVHRKQS